MQARQSRESCNPSADLPWEMQTWNWLCVTHRMTSEHFNLSNEEAQKELGAGAPTCPNAAGWGLADQPRTAEAPLSLPPQRLTPLNGICHKLTDTKAAVPHN